MADYDMVRSVWTWYKVAGGTSLVKAPPLACTIRARRGDVRGFAVFGPATATAVSVVMIPRYADLLYRSVYRGSLDGSRDAVVTRCA